MSTLSLTEIQRLRDWLADGAPISLAETETPAGQAIVNGLISVGVNGRDRTESLHRTLRALYNGGAEAVATDIFAAAEPPAPAIDVPALPAEAQLDPALAAGASPWLEEYAAFSARWSPQGAPCYHWAVAIWLLSTIAARRVVLRLGSSAKYTSLYLALVGRSSLYAKTTTARIGTDLLRLIGLDWLLAPDDSTPQKFISDLTGRVPSNYDEMPPEKQARVRNRLRRPAQRGWRFEEFGSLIDAIVRAIGIMAEFKSILRRMDDCADTYEYSTIGRGSDLIEGPYLALLASLTPADLKPAARAGSAFWGDGSLARFGLVTPTTRPSFAPFPQGEMTFPESLTAPLLRWHERLGLPRVDIEDATDAKGQPTGRKIAHVGPYQERACTLGAGVFDAFNTYHRCLMQLVERSAVEDLDASYARFAEKALRVAMLLASLENDGRIELRHWARAQQLTEEWRAGLHVLIAQLADETVTSDKAKIEDKYLTAVKKRPGITAGQIVNYVRPRPTSEEAMRMLDGLIRIGALRGEPTKRGTIAYHPVVEPGATP